MSSLACDNDRWVCVSIDSPSLGAHLFLLFGKDMCMLFWFRTRQTELVSSFRGLPFVVTTGHYSSASEVGTPDLWSSRFWSSNRQTELVVSRVWLPLLL